MKSQIDLLKSEAEANFSASRWEDSAKTYEHLIGLAQNNNDYEQAIDFALAAIRSWSKMPEMYYRINRLYQMVGLISLKKAAMGFEELAKFAEIEKNKKNAANHFEEAGNNYSLIQSFDRAKSCYQSSVKIFETFADEALHKNDFEIAIHFIDRIIGLYTKLATLIDRITIERKDLDTNQLQSLQNEKKFFDKKVKEASNMKATVHIKLADQYCNKKDFDANTIAKKEYENAITILESIGEQQEAKKIKSKIEKILKS